MDEESLTNSISTYELQLTQVNLAISVSQGGKDKEDLLSLKDNLEQLIQLTKENLKQLRTTVPSTSDGSSNGDNTNSQVDDEYALFMVEMEKEGALSTSQSKEEKNSDIENELKAIEGMKCRAPHRHQWGDTMYHNALVCSVLPSDNYSDINEIEVKVMFINPTHEEMLPCPYLMESSCKFDDEKCKYSHGEIINFSSLQEYNEPKFENLTIGSKVLAKQKNKLWHRGKVKRVFSEKCLVKFDSSQTELELEFHDVLPLEMEEETDSDDEISNNENEEDRIEDVINMSLLNTPSSQALGDWEKHTKGIGSKLMQKMGYIIGTGLGKASDGILDPVSAVVLPPGKSLDHCMHLREKSGGDKDLFSVERKLKKLQKRQEIQNRKAYEREKQKVNVFKFLNETLTSNKNSSDEDVSLRKSKHRKEIKKESSRNLNVALMKVEEEINKVSQHVEKIRETLKRHSDINTQLNKNLQAKLLSKQLELKNLKAQAVNITTEQNVRNDKKKLTIF